MPAWDGVSRCTSGQPSAFRLPPLACMPMTGRAERHRLSPWSRPQPNRGCSLAPRQALDPKGRQKCRKNKPQNGSHPQIVVNKMPVLLDKRFAYNALQPPAGAGILCLPSRRIGQRRRATRTPRWRHTARAVFIREDRLFVNMPLALSDKRIPFLQARPNILRRRFWDENPQNNPQNRPQFDLTKSGKLVQCTCKSIRAARGACERS